MKVIKSEKASILVPAGELQKEEAFKDCRGTYFIVLDMQQGYFDCSVRSSIEIDYSPIWVFNINTDTLGIVDADQLVEPVELEVNVKERT